MAQTEDTLLQQVLSMLASNEVADIIEQADADTSMSARERKETLVESGIALGVSKTRDHAMQLMGQQAELLRNTLKAIDDRMVDAMDSAEGMEFLYKLREGIVNAIRGYVRLIAESRAAKFHRELGMPTELYLSRDPARAAASDVTRLPAFVDTRAFLGFVVIEKPETLECACPTCLAREGFVRMKSPDAAMQMAIERFGSVDAAAAAFTEFVLLTEWRVLDRIEAGFGNVDSADSERVGEFTAATLSRLFNGDSHHG